MAQLGRTWLGLGALGAGLIHLAVAASSTAALLVVFLLLGAAEVAWGVAALAGSRLPLPRLALGGALLPVAVWLCTLVSTPQMAMSASSTMVMTPALPAGAMLGASLLDLLLAGGISVSGRRTSAEPTAPGPWRFLIGVLVGAGVVAVVTANSLAATAIGASTMPGMGH